MIILKLDILLRVRINVIRTVNTFLLVSFKATYFNTKGPSFMMTL
jgi:hypothetical protein